MSVIREWPQPTNVHELKSFIGLCSYYREFIKGCAGICDPLNRLLQKSEDFIRSVECNQAFQTLKHALTSVPILSYPMENGIFTLDTDASGRSIGAVLSQLQSGKERVIGFASRTLTKSERNYSVTKKELLSFVFFVKHFRHYLLGKKFKV